MTHNGTHPAKDGGDSISAVEADLDATRHELADTLDELASRLDVKTRGKQKAHEVKESAQVAARSRDVQVRGGIAATVLLGLVFLIARKKRRNKVG